MLSTSKECISPPPLLLPCCRSDRFERTVQQLPAQVVLGDWVYVAVSVRAADTELKIIVQRCFASPEADPESRPRLMLIENK